MVARENVMEVHISLITLTARAWWSMTVKPLIITDPRPKGIPVKKD
jgi:hypothetical protein